jgi:MarR family transcriptional regulator, organic hydroperoxide resistance regulator
LPLAEEVNAVAINGLDAADIATTRRTLLVMLDNLVAEGHADAMGAAQDL